MTRRVRIHKQVYVVKVLFMDLNTDPTPHHIRRLRADLVPQVLGEAIEAQFTEDVTYQINMTNEEDYEEELMTPQERLAQNENDAVEILKTVMFEDDELSNLVHTIVYDTLGYNTANMDESDPRYDMFYATMSMVTARLFAKAGAEMYYPSPKAS